MATGLRLQRRVHPINTLGVDMSGINKNLGAPVASKRDLVAYLESGCKPKEKWVIGTEHEKFVFHAHNHSLVAYDEKNGIRELLQGLMRFGWHAVYDRDNIIGLEKNGAAISLEPAGQLELSGAPLETLHQTKDELDEHFDQVATVGGELGLGFLGMGYHPTAAREHMPWMPKQRYAIMKNYMPTVGRMGLDMMTRTCTTQVNVDYADEDDFRKKMRVSAALQPVATALFAASPFKEGKPSGLHSTRMQVWEDTDNQRSGFPSFVFEDGFGFERYVDFALSAPMYFVYRDGTFINATGQKFSDFMAGRLPAFPGHTPTTTDWHDHLTTCFPDVRAKTYLEMRGADCGNREMIVALPAFWVGLLYDATALDQAAQLVREWSVPDMQQLRHDVVRKGLYATMGGRIVANIARDCLKLSAQGLRRRARRLNGGSDETKYLTPLDIIVETEQTLSDEWLGLYHGAWNKDISKIFEAARLV